MKDEDYGTPHDHYFGYINRRQGETPKDEERKQMEVIRSLGLEVLAPPMYDLEKGVLQEPKTLDTSGVPVNLEEIDVFELARLRGTTVSGLRELMTDRNARADEQRERLLTTG